MVNSKKSKPKKKKSARVSREAALKRHYERPKKARLKDECEVNKTVHAYPTKEWMEHPQKSDVLGIDVPTEIDEHGRMKVSKKMPAYCLSESSPGIKKALKGRKINPIYDPKFIPDEE